MPTQTDQRIVLIGRNESNLTIPTNVEELYDVFNSCSRDNFGTIVLPLYKTKYHESVYKELLRMFRSLIEVDAGKTFNGKTGVFAKVLCGHRGAGKSSCLRFFVSAASYMCSNVDCFYIDLTCLRSSLPDDIKRKKYSLCALINDELNLEMCDSPSMTNSDKLVKALCDKNRRLIIVLDKMDELFTYNGDEAIDFIDRTLGELGSLTNSRSGRVMIIASTSSSRLHDYFRRIHLNENRFQYMTLEIPRPDDEDITMISEDERKRARARLFCNIL